MLLLAGLSAGRMVASKVRRRQTEFDADGVHILMGIAMAGMFEPRLSPLPAGLWQAAFAAAAAWFARQAIWVRWRGRTRQPRAVCAHPAPHAVECVAMVYMLLPALSRASGRTTGAMPGMIGSSGVAAGNPVLALMLAVFMLGYILWTADRLAILSRCKIAPIQALAPRQAACTRIAMSIAMGYMLLMML